jgi:radical SAM protein with 4Fe4S-binding SPASM domain
LKNPPPFLDGINSLIFLNYKPIGRKPDMSLLLKDSAKIQEFYKLVNQCKQALKIGFDSCSISGVVKYVNVNSDFYEGCDAGRFSAFVDENLRMMPCSFMTNTDWFGDLKTDSMLNIWQNNSYFKKYRNNILNNGCTSCAFQKTCMGGCPFIEELSQCDWKDERLGLSF